MRKRLSASATRTVLDATVFALAGVAILIGLGVWQLERKVWKENLIATLNVAARGGAGRSAAARQLAAAEGERSGISPRDVSCRISRRRRGAGLHRRLAAAARCEGAGLLGVHAGAACRRQHRAGQSRLRPARPEGSGNATGGHAARQRRYCRRHALAGEARHRSRRPTMPRTMSGTCAIPMRSPRRKLG